MKTDEKQELVQYQESYNNLIQQGRDLKIKDESSKIIGIIIIRELKLLQAQYKKIKDYFTKDLKTHIKKIEGNITPYEKEIKAMLGEAKKMTGLCGQLAKYETEQENIRCKKEEELRKEQQKQYEEKIKEAEENKQVAPPPPMLVNIEFQKSEGISYRNEWNYEIVDKNIIPKEYLIIDDKKIKGVIKVGIKEIPGLRIFSIKVPVIKEEI